MPASNWVHLENCEIVAVSDKAILVVNEEPLGEPTWFPKSQVDEADKFVVGDKDVTVSITEWIANQKGIEE